MRSSDRSRISRVVERGESYFSRPSAYPRRGGNAGRRAEGSDREWNPEKKPPRGRCPEEEVPADHVEPPEPLTSMDIPSDFFHKGNFIPMRLVTEILSDTVDNALVTPITERGGDTIWHYHFDLGVYKPDGIAYVKDQVKEALGQLTKTAYVNEVLYLTMIGSYIEPALFVEDPRIIVVKNGVYHLDTGELTGHNAIHNAKAALPVKYDPDAKCPTILKFLGEVIPDDVGTFQKWFGYHFKKDMIFQKAAMFIGDGANGKTTLQNLMTAFLGLDNVSHVSLYSLVSNRFATSELYTKLANISPDIAADELKRTGTFKAATGRDRIRAEKKYRDPFYFFNHAKLTFLCNTLPTTPDKTLAFFRRWLLFVFPNKFEGADCDPHILRKLTTPEELSGLFNWALEGYHRLMTAGRFTKSATADEMQAQYEEMSDPITAFINEHIVIDTAGIASKDVVYQAYYQFCRDKGYTHVLKRTLTSELKTRIAGLMESKRKIRGQQRRCWTGIRLRGTQGTIGTLPLTPRNRSDLSDTEKVSGIVPIVPPEDPEAGTPLGRDDKLFTDAIDILQEQLKAVLHVIKETQEPMGTSEETLKKSLEDVHGINNKEADKLIGILTRDGTIYSPRPRRYRTTT